MHAPAPVGSEGQAAVGEPDRPGVLCAVAGHKGQARRAVQVHFGHVQQPTRPPDRDGHAPARADRWLKEMRARRGGEQHTARAAAPVHELGIAERVAHPDDAARAQSFGGHRLADVLAVRKHGLTTGPHAINAGVGVFIQARDPRVDQAAVGGHAQAIRAAREADDAPRPTPNEFPHAPGVPVHQGSGGAKRRPRTGHRPAWRAPRRQAGRLQGERACTRGGQLVGGPLVVKGREVSAGRS